MDFQRKSSGGSKSRRRTSPLRSTQAQLQASMNKDQKRHDEAGSFIVGSANVLFSLRAFGQAAAAHKTVAKWTFAVFPHQFACAVLPRRFAPSKMELRLIMYRFEKLKVVKMVSNLHATTHNLNRCIVSLRSPPRSRPPVARRVWSGRWGRQRRPM